MDYLAKKHSILYRAIDIHGNPFKHTYSKRVDEDYVADNYIDVARHIACSQRRCYALLQARNDDELSWKAANEFDQMMFQHRLSADFLFYESK